ncbi:MAG: response regulator [Anaerolineae bacterium]
MTGGAKSNGSGVTLSMLRQALLCLYSPVDLGKCALAMRLCQSRDATDAVSRGQAMRRMLLDAIEMLHPDEKSLPKASAFRAYQCVTLRYITGLAVEDIATKLCLGQRQVYRDLRWGEEHLLGLLEAQWHRQAAAPEPSAENRSADFPSSEEDAWYAEVEALGSKLEAVDLSQALREAIETVTPLASRRAASFICSGPEKGVVVRAAPGILRQMMVQLLSAVVQSSHDAQLGLELEETEGGARLKVSLAPPGEPVRRELFAAALRLADSQKVAHRFVSEPGYLSLELAFSLAGRQLLVVEDNPSAFALYERYLANSEWEPLLAPQASAAVALAAARRVEAIILDIMMPETDGWKVLQALKLDERTRHIPVVVCSVVDDRELGLALGAAEYLTKPVLQPVLLEALRRATRRGRPASGASSRNE